MKGRSRRVRATKCIVRNAEVVPKTVLMLRKCVLKALARIRGLILEGTTERKKGKQEVRAQLSIRTILFTTTRSRFSIRRVGELQHGGA